MRSLYNTDLILLVSTPNTKQIASITLDLPPPLGPTIHEKFKKGPTNYASEKDLKFVNFK